MIYSTVNHQEFPFFDPTHPPPWWRNTWMPPKKTLCIEIIKLDTTVIFHEIWHVFEIPRLPDYGHPMKPFFHPNPQLLGLGRQFRQIKFGAFGVFLANLSALILVKWVPCPCFPLINNYFYKKLSLNIQIPKIYLGVGVEFGQERIRYLVIVCL